FQADDGIRDRNVTGVQTCALPISPSHSPQTGQTVQIGRSAWPVWTVWPVVSHGQQVPCGPWSLHRRAARHAEVACPAEAGPGDRSEERRVGKEGGGRGEPGDAKNE